LGVQRELVGLSQLPARRRRTIHLRRRERRRTVRRADDIADGVFVFVLIPVTKIWTPVNFDGS
jgi:hypothetical protein